MGLALRCGLHRVKASTALSAGASRDARRGRLAGSFRTCKLIEPPAAIAERTAGSPCCQSSGSSDMPNYLGVDGFRGGLGAAWVDDRGNHGFVYFPGLDPLFSMPFQRARINMS